MTTTTFTSTDWEAADLPPRELLGDPDAIEAWVKTHSLEWRPCVLPPPLELLRRVGKRYWWCPDAGAMYRKLR